MKFLEAKDKNLADVLVNNRYKIDSFQREYRWQRKHIEALISDLSTSFEKNFEFGHTIEDYVNYNSYYMGPIVLCDDRGSLSIVDGQQRLTSFTLLLIFLYHAQNALPLEANFRKNLTQFFYVTKGGKTTLILNVDSRKRVIEHLYNNPNSNFAELENLEEEEEESNKSQLDESIQNIIERYEDITKLFPKEINTEDKLPIFIEWLLDKVVMVEVKAYNMENAYTIFETMNDRGLSLNPTEILKGFLLSKIDDERKGDEMNEFWKERITIIKSIAGIDSDLDFFRAWLRAKYAQTIRTSKQGAENEDFELIGTQFHSWVKNNPNKTHLKQSDDYYFFILSDFDFYSNIYLRLYSYKNVEIESFEDIYVYNFYPIADSLTYPLFIAPISKLDEQSMIDQKVKLVGKFIDIYANIRTIMGKAITQSSIRSSIYDLVKDIRNLDAEALKARLTIELEKTIERPFSPLSILHRMDNAGYYHYFFARILFFMKQEDDFVSLLRNRKQSSLVLYRMLNDEDKGDEIDAISWNLHMNSVAGFCLVRRSDLIKLYSLKKPLERIKFIMKQNYMPEMLGFEVSQDNLLDFIAHRDHKLRGLVNEIWLFN